MADEATNRAAFRLQEQYCRVMDAPITARICIMLADCLSRDSRTGARALDWPGEPIPDALPLRLVGGLHALALSGVALTEVFAGTDPQPEAALAAALIAHDTALYPWLDGPPQTNEPGRSGALMAGLVAVVRRFGQPLEIVEIGSSAGLNLLIDRYRFDLGGTCFGPADAPVTIRPEWRGPPPQPVPLTFASVRGVDIAPIDARDPEQAARLRAYVWADNPDRLDRQTRAIAMLTAQPVRLEQGDAADWLEARLAEPQPQGVTRVLMHSVVWQYLGPERQARITAAMTAAGAQATATRPLAWVKMEPDRAKGVQQIRVHTWPDGEPEVVLAHAQAHGAWVEPLG